MDEKLKEDVVSVLRDCLFRLDKVNDKDFGKPVLLIDRVKKAIDRLEGKPSPRCCMPEPMPYFGTPKADDNF